VENLNCGKQAGIILLCPSCEVIISVKPDALWRATAMGLPETWDGSTPQKVGIQCSKVGPRSL
jgi:hypothetical protein